MRQRLLTLALILLAAAAAWGEPPRHVVLLSIDGLRPEFYLDPEHWHAPNLQRLKAQGAWAERMLSVFPSITYANHTSLVTGVRAARHGVNSNNAFDQERGPLPGWSWWSRLIKAPALWDRARDKNVSTAAFSWPVSVGGAIDYNVPEIFSVTGANNGTTEQLIREHATPGLIEIAHPAGQPFPLTFAEWDAWLPGAFGRVMQAYEPRLTLIHMLNLDRTQHRHGREAAETHAALTELDAAVGELVKQLDPTDTCLLVVGDHGFQDYTRFLSPNRLFLDQGWLTVREGKLVDWRVIAHPNGGSTPIYCKDPALAPAVLKLLKEHAPGRYEVLERAELDRLEAFPDALCALTVLPGFANRQDYEKPFEEPTKTTLGNHGHLPELVPTGLIAWGCGVKPHPLGTVRVLDVAPTICRLLGLDGAGMQGTPLPIDE